MYPVLGNLTDKFFCFRFLPGSTVQKGQQSVFSPPTCADNCSNSCLTSTSTQKVCSSNSPTRVLLSSTTPQPICSRPAPQQVLCQRDAAVSASAPGKFFSPQHQVSPPARRLTLHTNPFLLATSRTSSSFSLSPRFNCSERPTIRFLPTCNRTTVQHPSPAPAPQKVCSSNSAYTSFTFSTTSSTPICSRTRRVLSPQHQK